MKRFLLAAVAAAAVVLEALPWSAAVRVTEKGETSVFYCSSFDPTPFVDRNFGPLLTAVATCLLLLFALIYLIVIKGLKGVQVLAGASFLFSLLPLLRAADHATAIGIGITAALLAEAVLSFLPLPDGAEKRKAPEKKRKKKRKKKA